MVESRLGLLSCSREAGLVLFWYVALSILSFWDHFCETVITFILQTHWLFTCTEPYVVVAGPTATAEEEGGREYSGKQQAFPCRMTIQVSQASFTTLTRVYELYDNCCQILNI